MLLFGRKLVPPWAHFFAAVMVAVGTLLSSFWILAANSWMQTPAGHRDRRRPLRARGLAADHLQSVVSLPARAHRRWPSIVTTAFVVIGVAAYYLRRERHAEESRIMHEDGAWASLVVLVPLQIVVGDLHGLNTLEHQPAKIAAMEGIWETQAAHAALLFAMPDEAAERNRFGDRRPGPREPHPDAST